LILFYLADTASSKIIFFKKGECSPMKDVTNITASGPTGSRSQLERKKAPAGN
jgi:hypothetical protein